MICLMTEPKEKMCGSVSHRILKSFNEIKRSIVVQIFKIISRKQFISLSKEVFFNEIFKPFGYLKIIVFIKS